MAAPISAPGAASAPVAAPAAAPDPTAFPAPAGVSAPIAPISAPSPAGGAFTPAVPQFTDLPSAAREARRAAILAALQAAGQNRSLAARRLGISRSALYYQMKQLGIS